MSLNLQRAQIFCQLSSSQGSRRHSRDTLHGTQTRHWFSCVIRSPQASDRFNSHPAHFSSTTRGASCQILKRSPIERSQLQKRHHKVDDDLSTPHARQFHRGQVKETHTSYPKQKGEEIPYLMSNLPRAPLPPCLSSPSRVFPSLSQSSPGGSQRSLKKYLRPSMLTVNKPHLNLDLERDCSSSSSSRRDSLLEAKSEILTSFLKNNGGYLDDSEDEDEEDDQDVSFMSKLKYPLQSRRPASRGTPSLIFSDSSFSSRFSSSASSLYASS